MGNHIAQSGVLRTATWPELELLGLIRSRGEEVCLYPAEMLSASVRSLLSAQVACPTVTCRRMTTFRLRGQGQVAVSREHRQGYA
jgi:hypothetical protein